MKPVWIEGSLLADAKVAVVLSTFNRPTMVVKTIESVFHQTYTNWNLYIVDNNSLPECKEVLLKFKGPGVSLYFSTTQAHERLDKYWLGVMINIGVKKGKEPYLVPLTDDCYLLPHSLETKVKFMEEHPEAKLCFGGQRIVDKQGNLLRVRNKLPRGDMLMNGANRVDLCQTMFCRKLVEEAGYFNEDIDRKPQPWIDATMFEYAAKHNYPLYSVGVETDVFVEHGKSQMLYLRQGRREELLSNDIWE